MMPIPSKGAERAGVPPTKAHPNPFQKSPPYKGKDRAAVIDLGTNNCRLLIAERAKRASPWPTRGAFRVVDSFSRIVRLGEGLGKTDTLDPAAIDRTIAALKICARKIEQSGARRIRAVATQACRQAHNGSDFVERVERETGIRLKTITPMQETRLGVSSTLPLLNRRWPHALIFDVGGGSTEVSFLGFKKGRGFQILDSLSTPLGVVSIAEAYSTQAEDLSPQVYQKMQALARDAFGEFANRNGIPALQKDRQVQTVGMSGTVTTVKALSLGLKTYRRALVDQTLFHTDQIADIRDDLIARGYEGLTAHGCIGRERADLVLPGVAILEGLVETFKFKQLLVLDRGLREGLLNELFKSPRKKRNLARKATQGK